MTEPPIADREWRLIPEEARPGPMQMALEEVAAETASSGGPRTVRTFRWAPSALSLGYRQDPDSVDWGYCERTGIDVTRRQTGGGGIYHDRDADVSYSIVAPAEELPGDLLECYSLLCTPVVDAFERMGVDAAFAETERAAIHEPCCYLRAINPAHDIVVGSGRAGAEGAEGSDDAATGDADPDAARKISGNAQYRQREAVIQHGSLSYELRPERHLATFADPDTSTEEFRERVTSIREETGIDRETAVEHLEAALADWTDARIGGWTNEELAAARELAETKYATESWTRDREAPAARE